MNSPSGSSCWSYLARSMLHLICFCLADVLSQCRFLADKVRKQTVFTRKSCSQVRTVLPWRRQQMYTMQTRGGWRLATSNQTRIDPFRDSISLTFQTSPTVMNVLLIDFLGITRRDCTPVVSRSLLFLIEKNDDLKAAN